MADRLRLGVIFGGQSLEHEVSVVSAQYVTEAASDRFDVVPIGVTKDGAWLTPDETQRQLDRDDEKFHKTLALEGRQGVLARPEVLSALGEIDVAFPLIHGTHGEDGTLQGLLELTGVAYVGSGVAASAIGMDKALMKRIFSQAGVGGRRTHRRTCLSVRQGRDRGRRRGVVWLSGVCEARERRQ